MIEIFRFARNVLSREESRKLQALKIFSKWIIGNYRLTWPQMVWWNDAEFNSYLHRFGEIDGFNMHRKWMLWQLLRLTVNMPGDTAECGVFQGASSWLICAANRNNNKFRRIHHLFDSFEGVSKPSPIDGTHWKKGDLCAGEDLVARNLSPFLSSIEFHKGWIPTRFDQVKDRQFAFIHVDVDLFEPTRDSIAFFYDRLSPGGIFLCDDYAFTTCPGATKAIDDFLSDKPEKMVTLDAGGGFFIKGRETSAAAPLLERSI